MPPSNKPTADTQITSPVSINTYPFMLAISSEIESYQTTPSSSKQLDKSPRSDGIALNLEVDCIYIDDIMNSMHNRISIDHHLHSSENSLHFSSNHKYQNFNHCFFRIEKHSINQILEVHMLQINFLNHLTLNQYNIYINHGYTWIIAWIGIFEIYIHLISKFNGPLYVTTICIPTQSWYNFVMTECTLLL